MSTTASVPIAEWLATRVLILDPHWLVSKGARLRQPAVSLLELTLPEYFTTGQPRMVSWAGKP